MRCYKRMVFFRKEWNVCWREWARTNQ